MYREMDGAQLELEYNPSSMINGDYQPYIERYIALSEVARQTIPNRSGIGAGPGVQPSIDLYYADVKCSPLHLFIHGGYWQELTSRESAVMAGPMTRRGINVAVMDYTLAPTATIEQMIKQCCDAFLYIVTNAKTLGIDPENVSISGHSAGAQLLMMMLRKLQGTSALGGVRLAVLFSGIYDLAPICYTSVNAVLKLSRTQAHQLSPIHYITNDLPRTLVAVAGNDTREFRRQAGAYHQALLHQGNASDYVEIESLNHFDIILALESRATEILNRILVAHGISA